MSFVLQNIFFKEKSKDKNGPVHNWGSVGISILKWGHVVVSTGGPRSQGESVAIVLVLFPAVFGQTKS